MEVEGLDDGRGVAALEGEALKGTALLQVFVGVERALGELGGEVGNIAVTFESRHKRGLESSGGQLLPVKHSEPGMLLDGWHMLHAFLGAL